MLRTEDLDVAVLVDPNRLVQALENLFSDAITYAGEDITVAVGLEDRCPYVADDGPGIPSDRRGEVFEKGYTTREDGSSYGLTIVRSAVEGHGWDVGVTVSDAGGARSEIVDVEEAEQRGNRLRVLAGRIAGRADRLDPAVSRLGAG
ncbi:hypothetical protein BRD05_07975 [Halobacteriales archaeon QS_9_70_65]|nr:MAG: hypothetical protein BRD05_07975 [Halobacteriales archaeon QS_9_70_65]